MEPIEVVRELEKLTEEIKKSLPESGRRFRIRKYHLPQEYWQGLMKDEDFAREAKRNNPNLGGIPVILSSGLKEPKIDYYQEEKQRKYFRAVRK